MAHTLSNSPCNCLFTMVVINVYFIQGSTEDNFEIFFLISDQIHIHDNHITRRDLDEEIWTIISKSHLPHFIWGNIITLSLSTGWERTVYVSPCPALYSGRIFVPFCRELIIFVF